MIPLQLHARWRIPPASACPVPGAPVENLESRVLLTAPTLDPSFGTLGKVTDVPVTDFNALRDARLQSDGKIVVLAGSHILRYAANGTRDTTFGAGGSLDLPRGASAFAVRADNKIVVVEPDPVDANNLILARYTSAGQLDTTFGGGDGEVSQPYFGGAATSAKEIRKLLIEPGSNRMYVAGTALAQTYDFALAAFNEDGTRYDQFGDTGQFTTLTDFGHVDLLSDAALAPNGDIVGVGSWTVSDSHHPNFAGDYAIVRWDPSGIPVPAFSGDGKTTVQFGNTQDPDNLFDSAESVAFDSTGNIVVAGSSRNPDGGPLYTSVARLKGDGSLDLTFSPGGVEGDGRALLALSDPSAYPVTSVATLPSGDILLANSIRPSFPADDFADFALVRLAADGLGTARTTTDLGANDYPSRVLLQSGKALVVGGSSNTDSPPGFNSTLVAMARYTLSSPFGDTPVVLTDTLQFENFDDGGEGIAFHDTDPINQGGAYRDTGADVQGMPGGGFNLGFAKAGEWTQYTAGVQQDGDYNVEVRLASLKGGGRFRFELDGNPLGATVTAPGTGDWQKYTIVKLGPVSLTAGLHVLRLVMVGNDSTGYVANFDSARFIRRVPTSDQTPFGGTPFSPPGRLQLENFDNGGEGVAWHDTDAVNQGGAYRNTGVDVEAVPASAGGGYALGFAKAGEWTEYTFVAPDVQGASYDLALRYAAPRGGVVSVEIDGRPVGLPVTLHDSAGWQDYRTTFPALDVRLAPGTHVLRLVQVQNGGFGYVANFDYLEFQRYREPFQHTPFLPGDTIQAEDFDIGGEGWTYHDAERANLGAAPYRLNDGVDLEPTTDTGAGYNVGFARAGEWIEYNIANETPADATVGIDVRVASLRPGGKFHFEIDGKTVASFTAPATGSWQTYTTLSSPRTIRLSPGGHILRLVMDQNNSTGYVANFNWMRMTA